MVKRKIVKQGAATMMVSLPSKWVKKNNLGKGQEIEIKEKGNELIITTESSEKKQTTINLTSLTESSIRTIVTNTYRLGYDKIKVNFKDKQALKIIQDTIHNDLLGFEITSKGSDFCEIENITEPAKEQFENIFSKIFLNIEDLFEIAEDFLQGNKQEFEQTEQKIKQFDNFCRRVISKNQPENSQLIWVFHTKLIHAQRDIYLLLRHLNKTTLKADKETLNLLKDCRQIFQVLKKAYKEKSIPLLEKVHDLNKEISKKGHSYLKKPKNSVIDHKILSSARGFYLASSPLIGLFISKQAEDTSP